MFAFFWTIQLSNTACCFGLVCSILWWDNSFSFLKSCLRINDLVFIAVSGYRTLLITISAVNISILRCSLKIFDWVIVCWQALKCVVLCIVLAPYDNEQADLIHRIKEEKALEEIPLYRYYYFYWSVTSIFLLVMFSLLSVDGGELFVYFRELLKLFTTSEIMRWQHLCTTYESALRTGSTDVPCTPMFIPNTSLGDARWKDLKHRVVEHVRFNLK